MGTPYVDAGLRHAGSAEVMFNGLFDEPAGTLARTIPRSQVGVANQGGNATGTVQAKIIALPAGMAISNIMVLSGTTAQSGGTHFWCGITDLQSNVLAVTADQTGATYVVASTYLKNALINAPWVVPQTGAYYVVLSASAGTTVPTFAGVSQATGLTSALAIAAPMHAGTMGTQGAPPAIGSQLSAISNANPANFAAWLS